MGCFYLFLDGNSLGIYLNTSDQALAQNSVSYKTMSLMSVIYFLLFPVSSTVLPYASGAVIALIISSSVLLWLFPFGKNRLYNHDERLFYFSVSFMVFVFILVTLLSGMDYLGLKKLAKFVYILMVIPIYVFFRTIRINQAWLWYGLVIGAVLSGIIGIYEVVNDIYKPGYEGRAKGATHPIIYGNLALIMGVMALSGWTWFKEQSRLQTSLPVVAVLSGTLASFLSHSRGGWLAIPFFGLIFIWFAWSRVSKLKIFLSVLALLAVLTLAYFTPQTGIKNKVEVTAHNVQQYFTDGVAGRYHRTSIGSRFEMWQASWHIFINNPLLGVGWGNYQKNANELVEKGVRNNSASKWDHPHNQFLSAMVSGGILALCAILLLFLLPIKLFYSACKSAERTEDVQRMALAGLVLMVGFAIFNLSESLLERSRPISFFIFYLGVFMAGIRSTSGEITNHRL